MRRGRDGQTDVSTDTRPLIYASQARTRRLAFADADLAAVAGIWRADGVPTSAVDSARTRH